MAILRSTDGKFYNVPDEELAKHLVPAGEVKKQLVRDAASHGEIRDPRIEVSAHATGWRNCWRNCYRDPKPGEPKKP